MTAFGAFWQYGYSEDGRMFAYYRDQDGPVLLVRENCANVMSPGDRIRLGSEVRMVTQIENVSSEPGFARVLTDELLTL